MYVGMSFFLRALLPLVLLTLAPLPAAAQEASQPRRTPIDEIDEQRAGVVHVGLAVLACHVRHVEPVRVHFLRHARVIVDDEVWHRRRGLLETPLAKAPIDSRTDPILKELIVVEARITCRLGIGSGPVIRAIARDVGPLLNERVHLQSGAGSGRHAEQSCGQEQ